jgi:hypothetical protein
MRRSESYAGQAKKYLPLRKEEHEVVKLLMTKA